MNFMTDFSYIDHLVRDKEVRNAVIDVDNTITKSNIVQFYLFIRKRQLSNWVWPFYFSFFVLKAPYYILLDVVSRDLFNKLFVLRKFKKFAYPELEEYSRLFFEEKLKAKFISFTHDLIFHLKEQGVRVTLLSTNFDLLIKQYARYFDVEFRCLKIIQKGKGISIDFSQLDGFKEAEIRQFDPSKTLSIGDSKYDLPALNHVDHPFVVASKESKWMKQLKKNTRFIKSDTITM